MNKKDALNCLQSIDHSFHALKQKDDIEANLKNIKLQLNKMDIKITNIVIVPAEKDEFFGMSIFSDIETAQQIVQAMAEKKPEDAYFKLWQGSKWTLEIDSKLLYDDSLNASPREITAALLHEVGHIMYTNSIPSKLHKVMSLNYIQLPAPVKVVVTKNPIFQALFIPVVCQASASPSYNLRKELDADKFAASMGYGSELEGLLSKLLQNYGSKAVDNDERTLEADLRVTYQWSATQASELRRRKDSLRRSITTISLHTPSKTIQDVFSHINRLVFKGAPSFTDVVAKRNRDKYHLESTMWVDDSKGIPCTTVVEMTLKEKCCDKYGKIRKITQQDVDIVEIQIDKIQTHTDKIYILDVIYDYMDKLEMAQRYMENGKRDKVEMNERQVASLKKQFEDARQRVINTKIKEREQYGVFIKYPAGYEG